MPSAGTPEVGVTALEFVILQIPGPVSWRQSARDPALLRWMTLLEEPMSRDLALLHQVASAPTLRVLPIKAKIQ